MRINLSESTSDNRQGLNLAMPQPGEIWEVNGWVRSPLEFSRKERDNLYSDVARQFLEGNSLPRYVMIVTEPDPPIEAEEEWQIVSVMVLSGETRFVSDVDLLIPSGISGLEQDLLAETWHVLEMLACNLLQPVGRRLSREVYDLLLSVGDYYCRLVDEPPALSEIQQAGLEIRARKATRQPGMQAFHEREEAWSDVLSVPLAAYRTYLKTMKFTNVVLDEALQLERELAGVSPLTSRRRVNLSQWFQNIFKAEWQASATLWSSQGLAIATRSGENSHDVRCDRNEIAALIQQLSPEWDERQRRRAAKRLGEIAFGNSEAIEALVNLLRTTQDDETLWTGVESLWKIDPGNPAAGVRRVKQVDLGMQVAGVAVALAVAIAQKGNGQVGVLLQVYPTGNEAYLPPDLKLILLDDSGEILYEVTARRADVYIQLKFSGQPGEPFSVSVALGEASITEDFAL